MARMNEGIKVRLLIGERSEMRPCKVKDKDGNEQIALFHCWSHEADLVDASPMIGGHPGGTVSHMVGIVEHEDGSVCEYYPKNIRFLDTRAVMSEYHFDEDFAKFIGE